MEGKFSSACEAISFLAARILVTIKKGLQGPFSLEINYLSIGVRHGSACIKRGQDHPFSQPRSSGANQLGGYLVWGAPCRPGPPVAGPFFIVARVNRLGCGFVFGANYGAVEGVVADVA